MRRITRDRNGNIAMITALTFLPLLGAAGLAVDYINLSRERSDLQAVSDAAALMAAGVSLEDEDAARAAAARYIASLDYGAEIDWSLEIVDGELQLSMNRDVPLSMGAVFGTESADVGARSHATAAMSTGGGLELALVLDVSNSMKNRMTGMKIAANRLVDAIYGTAETLPDVKLALVPFSGRVNFADYGWDWMNSQMGRNLASASPKNAKKDPFVPSASMLCNAWRTHPHSETDASPEVEAFPVHTGPHETCPVSRMIALTDSRSTIQNAINALTNNHGTSTQVGLLWGWRALSPEWQGFWYPDQPELPLGHAETPGKHLVIMTDGENHPKQSGDSQSVEEVNAQLVRQCQAMRAEGYTLYAVTYYMNGSLTDLYTACTGDSTRVYDANSAEELSVAFESIGGSLVKSALRLTR